MAPDPELVIYPSKGSEGVSEEHRKVMTIDVKFKDAYPDFDLYPAVYPFVCPYPVSRELDNLKIKSVVLGDGAPNCEQAILHLPQCVLTSAWICVDPAFDVYNTGVATHPAPAQRSVRLQAAYPAIALCT
jgi:hypothetical protein